MPTRKRRCTLSCGGAHAIGAGARSWPLACSASRCQASSAGRLAMSIASDATSEGDSAIVSQPPSARCSRRIATMRAASASTPGIGSAVGPSPAPASRGSAAPGDDHDRKREQCRRDARIGRRPRRDCPRVDQTPPDVTCNRSGGCGVDEGRESLALSRTKVAGQHGRKRLVARRGHRHARRADAELREVEELPLRGIGALGKHARVGENRRSRLCHAPDCRTRLSLGAGSRHNARSQTSSEG